MRLISFLRRQHIDYHFKKHWRYQGKRRVLETNIAADLEARGIKVSEPKDYFDKLNQKPRTVIDLAEMFDKPKPLDESHPEYKPSGIYLFSDSNVLIQGISQTQFLLKTIVFNELPEKVEETFMNVKLPSDVERSMMQSVLVSHLLDAEQQKTAKIINPLRPMRPYPRDYGITEGRKNMLISTRLLNHCERIHGPTVAADRKTISNAFFVAPFEKDGDKVQLELTAETFMSSRKPISPVNMKTTPEQQVLPVIFPLKQTVSIPKVHFFKEQSAYPINRANAFSHPHTIMLHYSSLDVQNEFETPVTSDQFESRAMLKGFAAAASRAQSLWGADVEDLERPITVQVVQLDSKRIQFGIFQLNTLNMNSDSARNYWFSKPEMNLYEECRYNMGRPTLSSYNFDVLRLMSVFYSN